MPAVTDDAWPVHQAPHREQALHPVPRLEAHPPALRGAAKQQAVTRRLIAHTQRHTWRPSEYVRPLVGHGDTPLCGRTDPGGVHRRDSLASSPRAAPRWMAAAYPRVPAASRSAATRRPLSSSHARRRRRRLRRRCRPCASARAPRWAPRLRAAADRVVASCGSEPNRPKWQGAVAVVTRGMPRAGAFRLVRL